MLSTFVAHVMESERTEVTAWRLDFSDEVM